MLESCRRGWAVPIIRLDYGNKNHYYRSGKAGNEVENDNDDHIRKRYRKEKSIGRGHWSGAGGNGPAVRRLADGFPHSPGGRMGGCGSRESIAVSLFLNKEKEHDKV